MLEYKSELEDGIDKYKNLRSWGNIEEKTGQALILFGTLQVGKNNERKQKKTTKLMRKLLYLITNKLFFIRITNNNKTLWIYNSS